MILSPTEKFPKGIFYTDIEALDLVNSYNWSLTSTKNDRVYVSAVIRVAGKKKTLYFHRAYANTDKVYFKNGLGIDCTRDNLTDKHVVGLFSGYSHLHDNIFQVEGIGSVRTEINAILAIKGVGQDLFLRKRTLETLELERTGQISSEEATYRYVLKYADNAWYYWRYGLEDYFRYYHIPVPSYNLDEQGFMIHPITGRRLCPFK